MSTLYGGQAANVTSSAYSPTSISSSTNATPIQITTSAAHGLITNDFVHVSGHLANTHANGTWFITVTGNNTFTLTASAGNGVGGATGSVQLISRAAAVPIFSDGDGFAAVNLNAPQIGSLDRTAFSLLTLGSYKLAAAGNFGTSIATTAQGVVISESIPPAMWAINNGNGSGLAQMNDASADPCSWILSGVTTNDLLEFTLDTSAQVLGTGASSYTAGFAIGYSLIPQTGGGSIGATIPSPSFGPAKYVSTQGSSETAIYPITLKLILSGFSFSDASKEGMIYIAPFADVNGSASETAKLVGDHHFSYRVWRGTGWPQ